MNIDIINKVIVANKHSNNPEEMLDKNQRGKLRLRTKEKKELTAKKIVAITFGQEAPQDDKFQHLVPQTKTVLSSIGISFKYVELLKKGGAINTMSHSKFAALNLVKAAMIALLTLSCISFVGCGKTDEVDTDKVDTLIQWLKDEDRSIRGLAAEELGEIKDARAVEPLIAELKDVDISVQHDAAGALGEIGAPAVEPLIAELNDVDGAVRRDAAGALGEIKDARAVEPLIAAFKDNNSTVRWSAAEALGKIKDARAVGPLIDTLEDVDNGVRREAIGALEEMEEMDGNQRW